MTFDRETRNYAIAAETIIVLGIDLLVFYHYYSQSRGLSVVSSVGVVLLSLIAWASLTRFVKARTGSVQWANFGIWLVLTLVMGLAGATVWMALGFEKDIKEQQSQLTAVDDHKSELASKADNDRLKTIAELANQITDPKVAANFTKSALTLKPQASLPGSEPIKTPAAITIAGHFEAGSIFEWFYKTGVHSLPLICGILGFAAYLAIAIAGRQAEETAEQLSRGLKPQTQLQSVPNIPKAQP